MEKETKLVVYAILAIIAICIVLIILSTFVKILPLIGGHSSDIKAGISTHLTGENGAVLPYQGPVLAPNGTLSLDFSLQAYYLTLVMALVDGKVVPFYYNGSVNTTHMIDVGENASTYMPVDPEFKIMGLSEGVHDVTILTFVDPYNFNQTILNRGGPVAGGSQSFAVIVANDTQAMQELQEQTFARTVLSSEAGSSNVSFLSKSSLSNQVWWNDKVRKGTIVNYYVNIGQHYVNGNSSSIPFRLIQLLDYEQIPVRYDSADLMYTGSTNNSEPYTVPLSFKASNVTGQHKLIVLLVMNPYQALDPTHNDPRWRIPNPGYDHVDITVF
jgi:hypothetical protein